MNLLKSKRVIIFILLIGLAVRLFLFFILTPWNNQVFEQTTQELHFDAKDYNTLALGIWKTNSLSGLGAIRTPAYPLLVAFFYYLFGLEGVWLVFIFQIILDLITVYLVYLIGKRISSSLWVGPLAAFLYATSFPTVLYSSLLLTEISFTFFIVLTIWLLIRAFSQSPGQPPKSFLLLGGAALTLGVATLIRPIGQYLSAAIVLFWLIAAIYQRKKIGRIIGEVAIFLFVFIIIISPWLIRNKSVYGYYELSAVQGRSLCRYYLAYLESRIEGTPFDAKDSQSCFAQELKAHGNPFTASHNCRGEAVKYILKNFNIAIPLHLKGMLNTFLGIGRSDILYLFGEEIPGKDFLRGNLVTRIIEEIKISKNQYFLVPILGLRLLLEYLFLLIGVVVLLTKKNVMRKGCVTILLILFIGYLVFMPGPFGYSRFRIPVVPLYLTFSAYGLMFVINKFRSRRGQTSTLM